MEFLEEGAPSLSQENTRNWCCSPGTVAAHQELGKVSALAWPGTRKRFETSGVFRDTGEHCPSSSWPAGASWQRSPGGSCQVWG